MSISHNTSIAQTNLHTNVLYQKVNGLSCVCLYFSFVVKMGGWLRVLFNQGNILVFLFFFSTNQGQNQKKQKPKEAKSLEPDEVIFLILLTFFFCYLTKCNPGP